MSTAPGGDRRPTILVADDDPQVRQLVRVQLEQHGYRVTEATDGASALSAATSRPIDLVLVDIAMPGADGYEVLRVMRSVPQTTTTPVVFISGRTPAAEAVKALGLGAHDYLRKPFDPSELLARVDAALRIKALQDQMLRRSADLEELNRTDPLTGLFNRRHLVEELRSMSSAALRSRTQLCVMMLDVDHFKAVNDGWGHPAGDRVLCIVAERLQRALRGADVAGRWGGEEFLLLLPRTTLEEGMAVARRIGRSVAEPLAGHGSLPPAVTVSIGCASGSGLDHGMALIRRADDALYRAKAAGRDRVEASTASVGAVVGTDPVDHRDDPARSSPQAILEEGDGPAEAVLAVLGGQDEDQVASHLGVGVEVVQRWRRLFLEGGRDRVAGSPPPDADETTDRYLAVIAHELMGPLTVVKGWAALLASGRLPPAEQAEAPAIIQSAAERMERTGQDILDSAAVALGRLRLRIEEVDVGALLEDVRQSLADDRIGAPVLTGDPIRVVADRDRLVQVAYNLMANALVHGGPGDVEVAMARDGPDVSVEVTSRGEPLDFDVAQHLFEPWTQGRGSSGYGVGLSVCRALVMAHGGMMGVRADGEITTFWLRIPTAGPPEGELVERRSS